MNPYFEALLPIISIIVTTLLGVLVAYVKKKYDIDVEIKQITAEKNAREALHSAVKTGMESAISVAPNRAKDELVKDALDYAARSVPDAIKILNPGAGILADIALSKLSEIVRGK